MPYFTADCGCELYAYVTVDYDCDCCGTDYSIEDAVIEKTCDRHTPLDTTVE